MSDAFQDHKGQRVVITEGWGGQCCRTVNLYGNPFDAADFVASLSPKQSEALFATYFNAFDAQPRHIRPEPSGSAPSPFVANMATALLPRQPISIEGRLSQAIARSQLVIQLDTRLDAPPDQRAMLRVKVNQLLQEMLADQRREAEAHKRAMAQESLASKALIYTGAFFYGLGNAAVDLAKWLKEVSDLANPLVTARNHYHAAKAAYGADNFVESYAANLQAAQWREIVDAIGFDPSRITRQQLAQAMDAVDLIWEDQKLRQMLKNFAWDYVKAQHAIELTELSGGAVLDIVITAILAALTAGAGIAAAAASKTRHLPKLRKLGDLLLEFVEQSKALARYARDKAKRGAKGTTNKLDDMPAEVVNDKPNEPPRQKSQQVSADDQLEAARGLNQAAGPNSTDFVAARRAYLNEKFDRTGDLNLDINIRGRQEVATDFFRSQGIPEGKIDSFFTGIDFTQPVEIQTIGSSKKLWQYQAPGAPQGNWYSFSPSVEPTQLGISPYGFNRAAQSVEPKVLNSYITTEPVNVLRSTSASVNDFWSVSGQSYPTTGGATQLFSSQKESFIMITSN